jgi:Fe-S-cluster-containing dehydrogenase component
VVKLSKRLVVCDPERCVGCQICEFACSAVKGNSCDPAFSRIRVVNCEYSGSMALSCVLCEKAPCIAVCPTRALFKNEKGVIEVDEAKCNGCTWCVEACKFGAITLNPTKGVVQICDLCDGAPECVNLCPFPDVLVFSTLEDVSRKSRTNVVLRVLQELGESENTACKQRQQDV